MSRHLLIIEATVVLYWEQHNSISRTSIV